jgi:hypothetical protein
MPMVFTWAPSFVATREENTHDRFLIQISGGFVEQVVTGHQRFIYRVLARCRKKGDFQSRDKNYLASMLTASRV